MTIKRYILLFICLCICISSHLYKASAQNEQASIEKYIKYIRYDHDTHILVIDYSNPEIICFRPFVGLKNILGEKSPNGQLKKNYKTDTFTNLLKDPNIKLRDYEPIAAFNTDYFLQNNSPRNINFIQGNDYSGFGNWTSLALSKDNRISFIREKERGLYNVVGGGPRLFDTFHNYVQPSIDSLGARAVFFDNRRTFIGITSNKKMIAVASTFIPITRIKPLLTEIASRSGGTLEDGMMFDGGGSPSMMYNNTIKIQSNTSISPLLLVFSNEACKYR